MLELQELHELQRAAHVTCYPAGTVVPLHGEGGRHSSSIGRAKFVIEMNVAVVGISFSRLLLSYAKQ